MPADNSKQSERELGYVEHVFKTSHDVGSFIAVRAVRITGRMNVEILRTALLQAQQEIEVLRAGIVGNPPRLRVLEHPELPLELVSRDSADQWQREAAHELHQRFGSSPLWRVRFLTTADGEDHELLFAFHHAISDGFGVTSLIHRVLTKCQGLLAHQPVDHAPQSLPPASDRLLREPAWRRSAAFILHQATKLLPASLRATRHLVASDVLALEERRTTCQFLTISAEQSRHLLSRVKHEQATVEGALCAAMLVAAMHLVGGEHRTLSYFSNLSLRSACGLPPEILGCFVYWIEMLQCVDKRMEFWQLARACASSVRKSTRRWGLPPPALFRRVVEASVRRAASGQAMGRTNAVGVSNLGRINLPSDYGPFRVNQMFSLTGQHAIGNAAHLIAGSLDGQLMASFMFASPLGADHAGEFVRRFQQALQVGTESARPT